MLEIKAYCEKRALNDADHFCHEERKRKTREKERRSLSDRENHCKNLPTCDILRELGKGSCEPSASHTGSINEVCREFSENGIL